jgi:hypothetical protein
VRHSFALWTALRFALASGRCPLPARPDAEDWLLILKRNP